MPLGNNQLLENPTFSAFAFHVRRATGADVLKLAITYLRKVWKRLAARVFLQLRWLKQWRQAGADITHRT